MSAPTVGTAVHLTNAPVESDEWYAARRARVNGSEIAVVMGISPYESPFSLWHRKVGSIGPVDSNDAMYWGNQLEPVIRAEWNRRHMLDGYFAAETGQWCHRDRTWQGGSPDGLVYPLIVDRDEQPPSALLEVKTARYDDDWGDEGTDEIPVHYRAQILWYLDVFGLDLCHVAVLISGSEYREYAVRYAADEVVQMRGAARAFLDTLEANEAPQIDGHEATYEAVKELHPDIEDAAVDLSSAVAVPYLQALAGCSTAEAEKRRAQAEVITAMGNAKHAYYDGQRIARRQAKNAEGSTPYLVAARGAADLLNRSAA